MTAGMNDNDCICANCGLIVTDCPVADYCENCPPHLCDDCGEMDSSQSPCKCWVSVSDIAFADLKGLFARDDLSLEIGGGLDG